MAVKYYLIDEDTARRAKEMNSFFDYKEGSATASYRHSVDEAAKIAEQQKTLVDPIYHEKIDHLVDVYARKLAENINKGNAISARVPSVMIAGPANFPVRKKEKQNRAADANLEEWRAIQGLLDKIRSTGKGGISTDDPAAVKKLQAKLESLQQAQENMKAVNVYFRKHKTLDGCPLLFPEQIEQLKADMARSWRPEPKPYESYVLTNNNAAIRQVKARIAELTQIAETEYKGWQFDGGTVEVNRQENRLQIFFDEKPDADTRTALKSSDFRWAPSQGAWQRQLNDSAVRAAKRLDCLKPVSLDFQVPAREWGFYVIADLKTWATNDPQQSPIEHFDSLEEAKARFEELRNESYNDEITEPNPDGNPYAHLTLGIESLDGLSAVDILHVCQGQNYLVDDFTRMENLRRDPAVLKILTRVSQEIGFDRVQGHEMVDGRYRRAPDIPFSEWNNPYFPAAGQEKNDTAAKGNPQRQKVRHKKSQER